MRMKISVIRLLDKEGNIPYGVFRGFSQEFYESESPLSIKSDQCICIYVIKGEINPDLPFFTKYGSFYINGTSRFVASMSEEEKGRIRNTCNRMGYESVALIPIRVEERIIGLIHLADKHEQKIFREMVEILENIAMQLGTALLRIWAEDELKQYQIHLEDLVQERTAKLQSAQHDLKIYSESLEEMIEQFTTQFHTILLPYLII